MRSDSRIFFLVFRRHLRRNEIWDDFLYTVVFVPLKTAGFGQNILHDGRRAKEYEYADTPYTLRRDTKSRVYGGLHYPLVCLFVKYTTWLSSRARLAVCFTFKHFAIIIHRR